MIASVLFFAQLVTLEKGKFKINGHECELDELFVDNVQTFIKEAGYLPFEFNTNLYHNEVNQLVYAERERQLASGVINKQAFSLWPGLMDTLLNVVKRVVS